MRQNLSRSIQVTFSIVLAAFALQSIVTSRPAFALAKKQKDTALNVCKCVGAAAGTAAFIGGITYASPYLVATAGAVAGFAGCVVLACEGGELIYDGVTYACGKFKDWKAKRKNLANDETAMLASQSFQELSDEQIVCEVPPNKAHRLSPSLSAPDLDLKEHAVAVSHVDEFNGLSSSAPGQLPKKHFGNHRALSYLKEKIYSAGRWIRDSRFGQGVRDLFESCVGSCKPEVKYIDVNSPKSDSQKSSGQAK